MTMIERIARTLAGADVGVFDHPETYTPEDPAEAQEYYRDQARAVLQAIREPSAEMVEAAGNQDLGLPRNDGFIGPVAASIAWHSMIDAALSE